VPLVFIKDSQASLVAELDCALIAKTILLLANNALLLWAADRQMRRPRAYSEH
jgi:hypothetical protein